MTNKSVIGEGCLIPVPDENARLAKAALELDVEVPMVLFIVDVDCEPAHKGKYPAPDIWRDWRHRYKTCWWIVTKTGWRIAERRYLSAWWRGCTEPLNPQVADVLRRLTERKLATVCLDEPSTGLQRLFNE